MVKKKKKSLPSQQLLLHGHSLTDKRKSQEKSKRSWHQATIFADTKTNPLLYYSQNLILFESEANTKSKADKSKWIIKCNVALVAEII